MKNFLLTTTSVIALSVAPSPAKADLISLAVAAASTAQAYATQVGIFSFGSLSGIGLVGANFAVRAALGYALNTLTTKPSSSVNRGYSVNSLGAALPHQIIYGETVIGGAVFYQTLTTDVTTDNMLHRCIAFAGHEISSYETIYINGEEVTLDGDGEVTAPAKWVGLIRINEHLGSDTQTADTDLIDEVVEWSTLHRAQNIAYLYCRFKGASNFPNGVPTVTAKIKGRKVYDSRITSTAWSDSSALCIRDYLLAGFGLNEDSSNINSTLFEDAADAGEVQVDSADTYSCNGSFLLDAAPEDIIRSMLSSMGGTFWNYGGQWAVRAAEYVTPTVTLNEDDMLTDVTIATRHSRRDNFNAVHGTFVGSETDWQPDDYTPIRTGVYLAEDGGVEAITDLPLLFTNTNVMAQRVAKTFLRRNRKQITLTAGFGLAALDLKISDTVSVSFDDMSWSSKVFEVVDWRIGLNEDMSIVINMILREMAEDVFTGIVANLTDENDNVLSDESGNRLIAIAA